MNISDLSIRRPVFAWMVMTALLVFGIISFKQMGVSQLPDVEFPVISVHLTWEGAAPEVMETDVVDIVEQAVMTIQGIKEVSSSVRQGQAAITVELELGRDVDVAVQEVQTKIAQSQRLLPKEIDPPIVIKSNPNEQPFMWITTKGSRPPRQIMEFVQDHLQDQFTTITGVGEVSLGGFTAPNLRVWLDADKLASYQLTVSDVKDAIEAQHSEIPAGLIETDVNEKNVRAMGEAATPEEFGDLVIARRAGSPVYRLIHLKDVAVIEDGLADVRRISRSNGETAIGLGIRKQTGANEVAVNHRVLKRLAEVKKQLPEGLQTDVVINRTQFIEDSIGELTFTLVLSALVTSLVCWLFLGSWSATLNVLLAIPTSVIGTFIVIHALHFTLNAFTVLALSLSIGIVVDDAIMVLENIVRYRENGHEKVEAASLGARQITFAAMATTAAIIAIFLPVAFMSGIIGKFFYEFGVTIAIAVALSLLEALMLTPMRCSQFLRIGERRTFLGRGVDRGFHAVARFYRRNLQWALNHKKTVLIAAMIVFAASLGITRFLRKEFVPAQDQSMFLCSLKTPVGSSIAFTDGRIKEAEKFVLSRPEVKRYFAAIGGFTGGAANSGILLVTFHEPRKRPVVAPARHRLSQAELMVLFRKELNKIPDLKAYIQDLSLSGFSSQRGFPVELTVRGPDWERLADYAAAIQKKMAESHLMVDVDTDYLPGASEIRVIPDRRKAAEHGVSIAAIGETINALVGGERVAKYTHGSRRYDVRLRLERFQRSAPQDIEKLMVWNNRGELVQLKDLVRIEERKTALTITRRSRERAITVSANVAPGQSQAQAVAAAESIAGQVLPDGYRAVLSGSSQTFKESFASLGFIFWLGILAAYMVLASQFNSYVHPLAVLTALPFSVSGALAALWMGNQSINIYSMIGIVLLMGIVKKNSILLVDFTNQMRAQGKDVPEALLEACPIRLRPILMTSLSTIAAAVPPALAVGPGAEIRIPMAISVIGGVLVSTLFTLFVVPCVYLMFARFERKKTF